MPFMWISFKTAKSVVVSGQNRKTKTKTSRNEKHMQIESKFNIFTKNTCIFFDQTKKYEVVYDTGREKVVLNGL